MFENKIFKDGISSVLKVDWTLMLKEPLCVRNGRKFIWNSSGNKSRNLDIKYNWNKTEKESTEEHELTDLHFDLKLLQNKVIPIYTMPPSSIRGTLRSWTVQHFLPQDDWYASAFDLSNETTISKIKNLINLRNMGFSLLTDLFGVALDDETKLPDISHASRISFETTHFSEGSPEPFVFGNLNTNSNKYGPSNARIQIKERGPIDRFTHAAQSGGLHSFLEFCKGQSFDVTIRVKNPSIVHVALIKLWEREMNAGMIRFGAVQSVGRGFIGIKKSTHILYSANPNSDIPVTKLNNKADKDIMSGVWQAYNVDSIDIKNNLIDYLPKEN